ncbi:MAG: sulfatase modifying factor 1 precursor [Verrucomicrobiales bacterium]|nr:sulfatase modifying factor 1 precursor [Verrucomicrobiales bacterium]
MTTPPPPFRPAPTRVGLGVRVPGNFKKTDRHLQPVRGLLPLVVAFCFCTQSQPIPAAAQPPAAAAPPTVAGPNQHILIRIPEGTRTIGAPGHPTNPRRTVHLAAYQLADAETTNRQFAAFIAATAYRTDAQRRGKAHIFFYGKPEWTWVETEGAYWRFPRGPEGPDALTSLPDHPVTCLSAADAAAYCRWAGGRLPTQAEWETAARAGASTLYPWGADFRPSLANSWTLPTHATRVRQSDGWEFTAPVRHFPPNAWGFYDVIGNVFEFTSDLPPFIRQKPLQPLTSARGGSWWCSPNSCKAFNLIDNGTMPLHGSLPNQGFRIAFTPP